VSQNIGVYTLNPSAGTKSALNLSTTGVIKASPGTLSRVALLAAGTTGGALTFNDSNALVTAQTITGITAAAQAVVTISTGGSANPFAVGNTIAFASVGGMTQINSQVGTVTAIGGVTTAWTITTNINSTAFTAWSSGGTAASFSAANEIYSVAESDTVHNVLGTILQLEWPCLNGILVSAVFSATPLFNVSYN
jgi:hypothetical protein